MVSKVSLVMCTALVFVTTLCGTCCSALHLYALFNMDGLVGTVNFVQEPEDSGVVITVNINTFRDPGNYSWYISSNLMSYGEQDRCNRKSLGNKVVDLTSVHGHLSIPTADDVTFRQEEQEKEKGIMLHGHPDSVCEKSLVLEGPGVTVCTNILSFETVRMTEAKFTNVVAGSIIFRQLPIGGPLRSGTTWISVDLFHVSVENPASSVHQWKILATDILDHRSHERPHGFCDHLTVLYDPDNVNDANCTSTDHALCKKGDLLAKHGTIPVGGRRSRFSRKTFFDTALSFPELEASRYLYVAIYRTDDVEELLTCARIVDVLPKETHARFLTGGVKGIVSFRQSSPIEPTYVTVNLTNLKDNGIYYHVHVYPVRPRSTLEEPRVCESAGGHFNPFAIVASLQSPAPGNGTFDKYEVGDLSGKYGPLEGTDFFGEYADPYVTLYGINSIVGRSIVIHNANGSRWICANLDYPRRVTTAVATFHYPAVGRVIFRQDAEDPLGDTTVFVESLLYSDGTKNNSANHRWQVHKDQISKDFYNWTNRCFSAGDEFNPYEVTTTKGSNNYAECTATNPLRCIVGDMTSKSGLLSVASKSGDINGTALFYTDTNLPLSGANSIIGRSLVLKDDLAPDFRGKRMACANIYRRYPARARVNKWFRSGSESAVNGRLEMEQAFDYDLTWTTLELRNLERIASGYHVHEVSVPPELQFPCSNDAVYAHYNPFNVSAKLSPAPGIGSSDEYELGDLSGKYGPLDNEDSVSIEAVDANLPVQGLRSIIGRSVVVHKKKNGQRWVCGDVRPDIREDGAKWIQAIASFHHPNGFAYGYIRFGQIEYSDGSLSDTTIEVNVRHSGKNNRNITNDHEWAVFVNQVGEDRSVKAPTVRCLAAGFRFNPYLVKSDRDAYEIDCNARNHLACEMGDLSGRQGTISVGGPRMVFTDTNLVLAGNYSAMKKSVVIHEKNGIGLRFACTNIEPDNDIVQTVQIKKMNRMNGENFIKEVREIMAVPEWMMYLDSNEERDVGACIQYTIYFGGPQANQIQLDFDHLLNTGKVERLYATAPGDFQKRKPKKFYYKPCSTVINNANTDVGDDGDSVSGALKLTTTSMVHVITIIAVVITPF